MPLGSSPAALQQLPEQLAQLLSPIVGAEAPPRSLTAVAVSQAAQQNEEKAQLKRDVSTASHCPPAPTSPTLSLTSLRLDFCLQMLDWQRKLERLQWERTESAVISNS